MEGVKHDAGKPRPTLVLRSMADALQQVIAVAEYGAKKYAPDNWLKVEPQRYIDAMLRHQQALFRGEETDPESGLPHLAHAAWCALAVLERQMHGDGRAIKFRPIARPSETPKFQVGDWVFADIGEAKQLYGRIQYIERDLRGYLVSFPGWRGGHAGTFMAGKIKGLSADSKSCWWLSADGLKHASSSEHLIAISLIERAEREAQTRTQLGLDGREDRNVTCTEDRWRVEAPDTNEWWSGGFPISDSARALVSNLTVKEIRKLFDLEPEVLVGFSATRFQLVRNGSGPAFSGERAQLLDADGLAGLRRDVNMWRYADTIERLRTDFADWTPNYRITPSFADGGLRMRRLTGEETVIAYSRYADICAWVRQSPDAVALLRRNQNCCEALEAELVSVTCSAERLTLTSRKGAAIGSWPWDELFDQKLLVSYIPKLVESWSPRFRRIGRTRKYLRKITLSASENAAVSCDRLQVKFLKAAGAFEAGLYDSKGGRLMFACGIAPDVALFRLRMAPNYQRLINGG